MFVECYAYVLKIGIIVSIPKLKGDTSLLVAKLFCPTFSLCD